ncbi:MAG: cell division protein SepF [Actinomadura sp.]
MAGLLRKAMLSFGLADDVDAYRERAARTVTPRPAPPRPRRQRIATQHPRQFNNDAPVIGELFRTGTTVIMDLSGTDAPTRTRFLDFGAGLAFGHGGRLEKVAPNVYLLSGDDGTARRRFRPG